MFARLARRPAIEPREVELSSTLDTVLRAVMAAILLMLGGIVAQPEYRRMDPSPLI